MTGTLYNMPVVVAASNFSFMGGSMGSVVGAKFVKAAEKAMELNCPFCLFLCKWWCAYARSTFLPNANGKNQCCLSKMREKGVPFISVLTDPTLGGGVCKFCDVR